MISSHFEWPSEGLYIYVHLMLHLRLPLMTFKSLNRTRFHPSDKQSYMAATETAAGNFRNDFGLDSDPTSAASSLLNTIRLAKPYDISYETFIEKRQPT